ncbi:MAG TPA: phosphatidylinositol-specific phospholipase C/glycerophosphodiester phosphodiesterase family protein [Mucilaginibacter sp.]|nr:phosphatidylinositol-specific phospholipase C/glycerophosphodiester phosphodiesterase family protein [Mucilaginibacter sp.]
MKARSDIFSANLLKTSLAFLLLFSLQTARPQSVPLPNAFAHNDYLHPHPLFDALANGYTNIEADIFLKGGRLVVAHIDPFFKKNHTLESLYLKPLAERIAANNGQVYRGYAAPIILMIDVKSGANDTYRALKVLLEKYRPMFSSYNHGRVMGGTITVVLSGHKPFDMIKEEDSRLAFIDEDLRKTYQDTTAVDVYKMASCKYSKLLDWKGDGPLPADQRQKLCAFVAMAHKYGKKVRLWASPENDRVWAELLKCGVDLINTDKLAQLKNFLLTRNNITANNVSKTNTNFTKEDELSLITL